MRTKQLNFVTISVCAAVVIGMLLTLLVTAAIASPTYAPWVAEYFRWLTLVPTLMLDITGLTLILAVMRPRLRESVVVALVGAIGLWNVIAIGYAFIMPLVKTFPMNCSITEILSDDTMMLECEVGHFDGSVRYIAEIGALDMQRAPNALEAGT